ncbi:MAG: hypothetical protein JKY54_13675 [Flavobacteriales bacterium]|nr:hypothetical protein [Flavobacteriales bacterium]
MEEHLNLENTKIITFKPSAGNVKLQIVHDDQKKTVWTTEYQIADLFGKARRTTGEHLQNVYSEDELEKESTWREFRQAINAINK